jgi:hypothetical protein
VTEDGRFYLSQSPSLLRRPSIRDFYSRVPNHVEGCLSCKLICTPLTSGITFDSVGYLSADSSSVINSRGFKSGAQSWFISH